MIHEPPPILPKALLFDMDGTLTRPALNFPRIKAAMGIGSRPILEALAEMEDAERAKAQQILHQFEEVAAGESVLNEGCDGLMRFAGTRGLPTALITRNSRKSVRTVLERHCLAFPVLITREDGRHKPHPDPLLLACTRLGVSPSDAWMIGDGQYDVEAGLAAGIKTVWISHGRKKEFAAEPWRTVADLTELTALLSKCR
jgi:HAD superfamily hydrolase (TIGR01509 family)